MRRPKSKDQASQTETIRDSYHFQSSYFRALPHPLVLYLDVGRKCKEINDFVESLDDMT